MKRFFLSKEFKRGERPFALSGASPDACEHGANGDVYIQDIPNNSWSYIIQFGNGYVGDEDEAEGSLSETPTNSQQ
jgi:hypothetical protein